MGRGSGANPEDKQDAQVATGAGKKKKSWAWGQSDGVKEGVFVIYSYVANDPETAA